VIAHWIDLLSSALTPASLMGLSSAQIMGMLVAATFISEDLACVAAGLLAAGGQLHWGLGILSCGVGIWSSDLLLYGMGRAFRQGMLHGRWMKRWVSAGTVAKGEKLIADKGTGFLIAARFLPGSRLPGYLAAGALRYPFKKFMLILALAVAVWTPLLCLLSLFLGMKFLPWLHDWRLWLLLPAAGLVPALASKIAPMVFTWRGRRLLVSKWIRLTRWEFWPGWLFYAPVVCWILWQSLRHRSLTVATLCNPGIALGGLAMESKSAILKALARKNPHAAAVATWTLVPPGSLPARLSLLQRFMLEENLGYPIVLKPDVGERGQGVAIIRDEPSAVRYLAECSPPVIAQRHVGGLEFGVFYSRHPGEACGRIISLAQKHPLSIRGDGRQTLEQLVLAHPRAVAMASYFAKKFGQGFSRIPAVGEEVPLAEIGTHCRGAIFTDARHHLTEDLRRAVDALTHPFAGFYYGRYDLRVPSLEALKAGRDLQVLELNGMTAEPVHIYDPSYPLWQGWRDACAGWSAAYAAGAAMRAAGHPAPSVREVWAALREHRHQIRFEADTLLPASSPA
jgi:membrane protein DedA with SNARE-associated domain